MTRVAALCLLAALTAPLGASAVGAARLSAEPGSPHAPGCPWRNTDGPCPHGHDHGGTAAGPRLVACDDHGSALLLPPLDLRLQQRVEPARIGAPSPRLRAAAPSGTAAPADPALGPTAPPPRGASLL